ncbi:thiamine-phosphate kinase, partial [Candidatus Latescibacterota bacterium]
IIFFPNTFLALTLLGENRIFTGMNPHGKTLSETGELEFIRRIRRFMPPESETVIRSVGDDCLVTKSFGKDYILSTTDTFVDGIHFTREHFSFEGIGKRCMSASVSDIAAMSGIPVYSLVSLSMPPETLCDDALSLFTGLQKSAGRYRCPVAGGETTSTTGPVTATVTVIGRVEPDRVVLRSGAMVGDSIYVTGTVGDAMAGLKACEGSEEGFDALKNKFLSPKANVELSRALTGSYRITAMIDISDGLATDLGHICEESRCGAEVFADLIPVSNEFLQFSERYKLDTVDFALSSGEEFELLFTSNDTGIHDKLTLGGHSVTRIGTVLEYSDGIKLRKVNNQTESLKSKGYEHFST